jgi:hypothetical protein
MRLEELEPDEEETSELDPLDIRASGGLAIALGLADLIGDVDCLADVAAAEPAG